MKAYLKIGISFLLVGVVFTAFMGFAHTKAGRPVLVWLGHMMGKTEVCPLGYDHKASLADREQMRKNAAVKRADKSEARSRTALDFQLGQTTRAEVVKWAEAHQGKCQKLKSDYEMECVGGFFASDTSTLWAEFDVNDCLVSLRGIQTFKSPEMALSLYNQVRGHVRAEAGTEMVEQGEAKPEFLLAGLLRQSSVSADFRNYSVTARISNMGEGGIATTQEYLSF